MGLVGAAGDITDIRINMLNLQSLAIATVQTPGGGLATTDFAKTGYESSEELEADAALRKLASSLRG